MTPFETVDISGDAGIQASGRSLEDLFANAAIGMYSLITDPAGIEVKRAIDVAVNSDSLEGMLVAWLNELIFQFDTYGFLGKEISIKELVSATSADRSWTLRALVSGEDFDEARHERRLLIKAATYHQLSIRQKEGIWEAKVILDI